MKIRWKKQAFQDLDRVKYFLINNIKLDTDSSRKIIRSLKLAPIKLLQFPRIGQLVDIVDGEEVRRILVNGYKIYYKVEKDTIVILSVLHDKEDLTS